MPGICYTDSRYFYLFRRTDIPAELRKVTGSGYDSFACSSPAAGGYISLIQADLGSGGDPVYALFRPYGAAGNGDADPLLQCSWLRGIRFDRAFHRAIRGDDRSQAGGGNGKLSRFLPAGARLLGAGLRHPGASRRRGICTDCAPAPSPPMWWGRIKAPGGCWPNAVFCRRSSDPTTICLTDCAFTVCG